jgi:hypothetical protein
MMCTTFWHPDGTPMSAQQFMEMLFGELPDFFHNEDELRTLWSDPATRKKLLEGLAEKGFGRDQMAEMQKVIDAEKSDLFDVLAHVAYASPTLTREERAEKAKIEISSRFNPKQQVFLSFVLKLLGDMGWTGNRETPTVLSLLVFEDLVMAILLPILGVLALGGTFMGAVLAISVALIVMIGTIAFAYRQGDKVGAFIFHTSDEVSLLTVFGLTLVVSGLAEGIGISAAVGAFLVGISVSGPAADRARALLTPLRDLFAAVFFLFFGLSTDPGAISGVLLVAVALGVVTAFTKFATGNWAARRAGSSERGRVRAGLVLIPRGEFSIIIAGLGAGLVGGEQLPALAAVYVLLMVIAGPLIVRLHQTWIARLVPAAH